MDEESDFSVEFTESTVYFSHMFFTGRVQGRCGSWCWPRATSGSSMADRGRRTSVKDQRVSNSAEIFLGSTWKYVQCICISHYMWMNEWIMRSSMNESMNESCHMNLHRQFLKAFAVVCLIAQTLARWVNYPYILMVRTCSKTVEVCCFFPTSSSGTVGWKSFAKRGGRISEEYPILPLFLTQVSLERSLKLWAEKGYHGDSGEFDRSSLIHCFFPR